MDKYHTEAEYLDRYPGDEWVDLVGVDNYGKQKYVKLSLYL
jgi:mannan endo-1,4-beta-mannosidase